ncbi:hypothetical protein WOLCODRAFT_105432 [Wolfiporia cocos MD-104 SS10]|uniref:MFS general substrate transporter n=1 Tax=Wolfiporia cocos (strain MD-104) TaxID=742152 RepID=A0A2H3JXD3_WOLCO|nr:hypothetical protein WOLCODRAFT_105432 [Wolfiporia cocos MD-104 SS10]
MNKGPHSDVPAAFPATHSCAHRRLPAIGIGTAPQRWHACSSCPRSTRTCSTSACTCRSTLTLRSTPMAQVILVGITCFGTVGMYQAVLNLGAGGTGNLTLFDTANGILYGFFAVTGCVSGGINNVLGPRLTLFLGTIGYALYLGGIWCYQARGVSWFLILAAALLGVSAALLWSAQGCIMMSYPLERDKGRAFAYFWAVFQLGTLIGAIIAFAINIQSGGLGSVGTGTYLAFLIIIAFGIASALLVLPPDRIVRADGTRVSLKKHASPREEIVGMWRTLRDWRVFALLPMWFASIYFYPYQGALNTSRFDGVTRSLNAVLEGAGAIIGALLIGVFVLDSPFPRLQIARRTRGYLGLGAVVLATSGVWACGLAWQVTFTRADAADMPLINYRDKAYRDKAPLFFFYYFSDSCYQALSYWIMSALTNDPFKLARFAGVYKAVQSAGAAGSFGMDAVKTPFLNEVLASWLMMIASFPLAFLVLRTVKETSYVDDYVHISRPCPLNGWLLTRDWWRRWCTLTMRTRIHLRRRRKRRMRASWQSSYAVLSVAVDG